MDAFIIMLRNWSPITRLSKTPDVTVLQTSDTVLWMLFRSMWVMAWSMPLATIHEPKHMAQRNFRPITHPGKTMV